ncbi:S1C family serine protease [Aestuariimicrobium soli]|uniref:S1C family serine protease n=1 Tax=Aestuariimicrobium soli TaxID=2035834 RepID=UPI003EBF470F
MSTQQYPNYVAIPQQHQPVQPPVKKRRGVASFMAVAVLAAGIGGGTAWTADRYLTPSSATSITQVAGTSSTVTKVVQGNSSNPDWSQTAAAASTSVVSITVTSGRSGAEGTGVIWDASGHIVTNNHVVSGLGTGATITVQFGNATYDATVVGTDASSDLAVIKIASLPKGAQPITVADSDKVTVGQAVMAIGNPLGLSDTVTTGIVSALNRPVVTSGESTTPGSQADPVYTNAIQTSAPINPGNSGGALVNANGELVGINSAIATLSSSSASSQSGSIGIGFAIPSNDVAQVVKQLIATGSADHAYLGLSSTDGSATAAGVTLEGARVTSVASGTPAADAGLQAGDVITAVNQVAVTSSDSLVAQIRSAAVGEKVTLTVVRNGATSTLTATLVAAPKTESTGSQPQVGGR